MSNPNWAEYAIPIDASAQLSTPGAQVSESFDLAASDALNWLYGDAFKSQTGIVVTEQIAETFSAVWAATRALAGTLASLPAQLYELTELGRRIAAGTNLSRLLTQQPNPDMDAFTFYELMMKRLVNQGNAFAVIDRNEFGEIRSLFPVHNSRVRAVRGPSTFDERGIQHRGELVYHIYYDDTDLSGPDPKGGHYTAVAAADMLNIVGPMSDDGILAPGVIGRATESIGMGLATERYGASFFGNDAKPSGVLEHPDSLDGEARENIRREWNKAHAGPNNWHNIAVLWENMKYHQIGIAPEQAQFLGTRQFNIQVIAQWYGIAPAVLQDYKDSKFQSVEAQIRHFQFALREWAERIERAIKNQILMDAPLELEFSMRSLLRGDPKAQAETNQIRLQNGALQLDEWRAEDGLNPMENAEHGSTHFMMGNLFTVDRVVSGEAVPNQDNGQGQPGKPKSDKSTGDENTENSQAAIALSSRLCQLVDEVETLRGALRDAERAIEEDNTNALNEIVGLKGQLAIAELSHERFCDRANEAFRHAATRMVDAEWARVNTAAKRSANKPGAFESWLDSFVVEFEPKLVDGLKWTLGLLVHEHDVDRVTLDVARHHLRVLKSRLLEAKAGSEGGDLSFLSTAFEDLEIEYEEPEDA